MRTVNHKTRKGEGQIAAPARVRIMMKISQRKLLAAVAVLAAVTVGAGGTLAYLTDNESHTNTFTVGDVKIDLVEENWDPTDEDDDGVPDAAEDAVPNQEIEKDPRVVKAEDANDTVVFLRVTAPVRDVSLVADDGTVTPHEPQEIFFFKQKNDAHDTHANHWGDNWVLLAETDGVDENGAAQKTYVFGFAKPLTESAPETTKLFEKVQLKNVIENEISADEIQNVRVEAFAIQADNVLAEGQSADELGKSDLTAIYDVFVKQNGEIDENGNMVWNRFQEEGHGQTAKEADTNNELNLKNEPLAQDGGQG